MPLLKVGSNWKPLFCAVLRAGATKDRTRAIARFSPDQLTADIIGMDITIKRYMGK